MKIRCTSKLLKEIGVSGKNQVIDNTTNTLGDWHANLFYLERKKNVIFCNDKTLYTVVAFGVNRELIQDPAKLLRHELGKTLIEDGLEGKLIQNLVDEIHDIDLAPTNNRSIVGVMVDHVKGIRCALDYGDWEWNEECFQKTIKMLNRTPLIAPRYSYAVDLLGSLLNVKISKDW